MSLIKEIDKPGRGSLIDYFVDRPRLAMTLLIFLCLAGFVAMMRIPKESSPDITLPVIYVNVTNEGISPEDSERLILKPLEQGFRSLSGVKRMTASGYEGGGNVTLEFSSGFDVKTALADVRAKVDEARRDLPDSADEPVVTEVNFSLFPVITVMLSGDVPERALLKSAREFRDAIESNPQVLSAEIVGAREEVVEVIVDPTKIDAYGLSLDQVAAAMLRSNRLIAAGSLETGSARFAIKVPALIERLPEILNLPLKTDGGAVVRVSDVATVQRTFKDATSIARLNGRPAMAIEVSKRSGQNLIQTIEAVKASVDRVKAAQPSNIRIDYISDESNTIRDMLGDLENSVALAVVLVLIIILFTLSVRASLVVGLAIPVSFLIGILWLFATGMTMNMIVLFSLILAVGMLVDDSIIVVEYAERRMAEGASRRDAFKEAANRMAMPVVTATLTRIAAFSPMLFWPDVMGDFMSYMPITLIATLSASLVFSLFFAPALASILGRGKEPVHLDHEPADPEQAKGMSRAYVRVLGFALRHPAKVLVLTVLLMFGTFALYGAIGKGNVFFADVDPDKGLVYVHARGNLSIAEKDRMVASVEERLIGIAGVSTIYTRVGDGARGDGNVSEDVIGTLTFEFVNWRERAPGKAILEEARRRTADLPGLFIEVRVPEAGPPVGKPVQVEFSATDPALLPPAAEKLAAWLKTQPDMLDIDDGQQLPGLTWALKVDRGEAARAGVDISSVGLTIQLATLGVFMTEYRPSDVDEAVDIMVRFPPHRRTLDELDAIRIATSGGMAPISSFVTRAAERKVGTITRIDARRTIKVSANLAPDVLPADAQARVQQWLDTQAGYNPAILVKFGSDNEEQQKTADFLSSALGVALLLIFAIMLWQFNNFYSVAVVLSSIVLSTVGVFLGLMVMGQTFSIVMNGIAIIALAGVIVNNNIILIDTYDRLRATMEDGRRAILLTGAQRMRPVLLTAVTAILGVLPTAYGVSFDLAKHEIMLNAPATQWWIQLSTGIAYGLGFGTILTLIVTPCALMVRENLAGWMRRRKGRAARPA